MEPLLKLTTLNEYLRHCLTEAFIIVIVTIRSTLSLSPSDTAGFVVVSTVPVSTSHNSQRRLPFTFTLVLLLMETENFTLSPGLIGFLSAVIGAASARSTDSPKVMLLPFTFIIVASS